MVKDTENILLEAAFADARRQVVLDRERAQLRRLVSLIVRLAQHIEDFSLADWSRWLTICRDGNRLEQSKEDRLR